MPRANRYFIPHQVYHLTHRCHDREFLLKFARDRNDYRTKLREGIASFDVSLLEYSLTRNHVHLLASAEEPDQICGFMQKVEGEFAQYYNRRKQRHGAYWEDRYHATLIESGEHLEQCMVYIALNMVRCGVVAHPREWDWCGYHELMGRRQRYRILDLERVLERMGESSMAQLRQRYEELIREQIAKDQLKREAKWTESIAVGSEKYVGAMAEVIRGRQRLVIEGEGDTWILKEPATPYIAFRAPEMSRKDHYYR